MNHPSIRLVVAALTVATLGASCEARNEIIGGPAEARDQLPVEVLGDAGTTRSLSLLVSEATSRAADGLALRVHNLGYANKASVSLNDGPWIPLNDGPTRLSNRARELGGIGGGLSTIDLTVPLGPETIHAGSNRVAFRFNGTDGASIGYRIIRVQLVDAGGLPLPLQRQLAFDDPVTWKAPVPGETARAEGERLWHQAALSVADGSRRRVLRSRCRDCHAQDGRDLQAFAYSNDAIVAASRFYGLTADQGLRIASYVRSLRVRPAGRPWNPPYQPGSGLDAQPIESWTAGAGLDAVAADDAVTTAASVPSGTALSSSGTLNLRELPIPFPLPDWNHWLPRVSPLDSWGSSFDTDELYTIYTQMRQRLRTEGDTYVAGALADDWFGWSVRWMTGAVRGEGAPQLKTDFAAARGTGAWMAVKAWELAQEFSLESAGARLYAPLGEPRTWIDPAGLLGTAPAGESPAMGAPSVAAAFEQLAWAYLSLVVNPGNRRHTEHMPIDWATTFGTIAAFNRLASVPWPSIALITMIKAMQEMDNTIGPEDPHRGWTEYFADPTRFVDTRFRWDALAPSERVRVQNAFVGAWLDRSRSFAPERYARKATPGGWASYEVELVDHVPTANSEGNIADRLYDAIPKLRVAGVDAALLGSVCDWAATMWPKGDWARLRGTP